MKSVIKKIKARIDASKDENAENPPWVKQVAMLTGVLAAVSGFLAVRSTSLTNDAIYQSNQAILAQTESSDAWNEYQADSIKAHVLDTALTTANNLTSQNRAVLKKEAEEFHNRQPEIKKSATDKALERDQYLKNGLQRLNEKDLLGYAEVAAQIGIALASVAALVRVRVAFHLGIAAGLAGILITIYAFIMHYGIPL